MKKVFLGGTCGSNKWREEIVIPGLLERGVSPEQIINPVVPHWTPEMQTQEDAAKADPDNILLFVLASPDPSREEVRETSFYSGIEATIAAFVSPDRLMILVDTTGMDKRTAKGLNKAALDWWRIMRTPVYREYGLLLDDLAVLLKY